MGDRLRVYEVGPRDGLQNGEAPISTEQKTALIDRLVQAGIRYLEVTSFVSPKAVSPNCRTLRTWWRLRSV